MNNFFKWISLGVLTLVSQNVAFTLYTIANPQTMGFMGDETPYGFEKMIVALILLVFLALNFIQTGIWQRKKEPRATIKILLFTFIGQTIVTSSILLGPLYYYRWFVAN